MFDHWETLKKVKPYESKNKEFIKFYDLLKKKCDLIIEQKNADHKSIKDILTTIRISDKIVESIRKHKTIKNSDVLFLGNNSKEKLMLKDIMNFS